jgi:hypothetical protein
MTTFSRLLVRVAVRIQDQYELAAAQQSHIELPEYEWRECQRLLRLSAHAERMRWDSAYRLLQEPLRRRVSSLGEEFGRLSEQFATPGVPRSVPQLRDLYDELVDLHEEFDDVRIDLRNEVIAVRTEPIVLLDVELGPFEISWVWSRLQRNPAYWVRALDPHPAASDSSLYHPHIRDEVLCEGDGRQSVRNARDRGHLAEFFLIICRILETYNPGSPYASLAHWEGRSCASCGDVVDEDDCFECSRCGDSSCMDCSLTCGGCHREFCGECISTCAGCDARHCSGCLESCSQCDEEFCHECLTNGRCGSCTAEDDEEDAGTTDPAGTTADRPSPVEGARECLDTVVAICAGGLGQADDVS